MSHRMCTTRSQQHTHTHTHTPDSHTRTWPTQTRTVFPNKKQKLLTRFHSECPSICGGTSWPLVLYSRGPSPRRLCSHDVGNAHRSAQVKLGWFQIWFTSRWPWARCYQTVELWWRITKEFQLICNRHFCRDPEFQHAIVKHGQKGCSQNHTQVISLAILGQSELCIARRSDDNERLWVAGATRGPRSREPWQGAALHWRRCAPYCEHQWALRQSGCGETKGFCSGGNWGHSAGLSGGNLKAALLFLQWATEVTVHMSENEVQHGVPSLWRCWVCTFDLTAQRCTCMCTVSNPVLTRWGPARVSMRSSTQPHALVCSNWGPGQTANQHRHEGPGNLRCQRLTEWTASYVTPTKPDFSW